ncbi:MAG: phosphorylase [Oscillospiraceae bacterium]
MSLYKQIKEKFNEYNPTVDMLKVVYGIESNADYDAIIVAPSWKPEKIFKNFNALITVTCEGPYFCGYEVNVNSKKYGYIQTASGAGNMIDCCLILGNAKCNNIIFIGAVGALCSDINLGDIVTSKYSIAGDGGSLYLYEKITTENYRKRVYPDPKCQEKIRSVSKKLNIPIKEKVIYCTDTIFGEYYHLDDIKQMGSELIEMETASFLRCMELIQKQGLVLLCVSDNSASGHALVGRSEEHTKLFHEAREIKIPKLIMGLS